MEKLDINIIKQLIKDEKIRWIITAYYPDNIEWENDMKTRKEIE